MKPNYKIPNQLQGTPASKNPVFLSSLNAHAEKGVALILVLWIMVFLGLMASELAFSMRTEVIITRNFKEEIEAGALAEGGIALALAEILQDYQYVALNESGETVFIKKTFDMDEDTSPYDRVTDRTGIPLGNGNISYTIVDEERKININTASKKVWTALLEKAGLEIGSVRDTILDSIEDWKDRDDLHRLNGAEDDYYMFLPEPYHCKNGKFDTVDELLLVKEMTREILYGDPEDPEENGIHNLLTVYGGGRINKNTAPFEVLEITEDNEERAATIIQEREEKQGKYNNDKSFTFTITATGSVDAISRTIRAVGKKEGTNAKLKISMLFWKDDLVLQDAPSEDDPVLQDAPSVVK